MCALEYAAKEGHTLSADALAAASSLPGAPRLQSALQATARAPWLVRGSFAAPLKERQDASALLVQAVRRRMQPHSGVLEPQERRGPDDVYFVAGHSLLSRLTALDGRAAAEAATLRLRFQEGVGTDTEAAGDNDLLYSEVKRAADAAAVMMAVAGALAAPGLAPLRSVRFQGFRLPASHVIHVIGGHGEALAGAPLRQGQAARALTAAALTALCDAMAAPSAARDVTLELALPAALLRSREAAIDRSIVRLPSAVAGALARALRAGWAQDGALRSLRLVLPVGMRLCYGQSQLLGTRALEAPHSAVTMVLLGAYKRCGARSPLRLLSAEPELMPPPTCRT